MIWAIVVIFEVLGLLTAVHAVMSVRTPQGTIAWVAALVTVSPASVPAYWVFGRYRAAQPGKLVAQFYGGELLKLAFVALVFAVVIIWVEPLSPLPLFGAFFVVQVLPPLLANRVAG